MKKLSYNLCLILILFSCQSQEENTTKKVSQKRGKKTETQKVKEKLKPNLDCKQTLQWLRENAIAVNPDTFPSNLYKPHWDYDSIYKPINKILMNCFDQDSLRAKYYAFYDGEHHFDIFIRPIYSARLCDIYTNDKNQIKAFTMTHGTGDGGVGLFYVSMKPNQLDMINIVQIADSFGDMGFVLEEYSTWLNDSTLLKHAKRYVISGKSKDENIEDILYKGSVQIHLHENGKISFSNPQIIIHKIPH